MIRRLAIGAAVGAFFLWLALRNLKRHPEDGHAEEEKGGRHES